VKIIQKSPEEITKEKHEMKENVRKNGIKINRLNLKQFSI
jgi:hypothetical protein